MGLEAELECYCDFPSYRAGDAVDCHAGGSATTIDVDVFRSAASEQLFWSARNVAVDLPVKVPAEAVRDGCDWPVTFSIPTGPSWPSGGYVIRLRDSADGSVSCEGFFVLRPSSPSSRTVIVITTNTYQAYNDTGGGNTYAKGGADYTGGFPVVSWRRPLPRGFVTKPENFARIANLEPADESIPWIGWAIENGLTIWGGGTGWSNWERPFVAWAEMNGFAFDYATSHDLHTDPTLLDNYDLMLSVGHDEYWSWEMRDQVERHVQRGGNVCFFSGNTAFWQVRFDEALRMTAYKAAWRDDPILREGDPRKVSGLWSNHLVDRPENRMTGVSFTTGGYARVAGASPAGLGGFIVYRPDHWIFEGTGLRYGDVLGRSFALVGYEVDGCRFAFKNGRPVATSEDGTPKSFEILGMAPAQLLTSELAPNFYPPGSKSDFDVVVDQCVQPNETFSAADFAFGHATMGIYQEGGTVFTSATTEWACGLAVNDHQIETITRNLLSRLAKTGGTS